MTIFSDVLKELFKMFVADLRLTLATLAGVVVVAVLLGLDLLGPAVSGIVLMLISLLVLAETVIRAARRPNRPR